jgi:hypothetical protein
MRIQPCAGKDKLKSTSRYEEAAEFWLPYLRGQAYLQLKESVGAAAEFQKIHALAQLGLARATQSQKA